MTPAEDSLVSDYPGYPERYLAKRSQIKDPKELIEELWKHDVSRETKLWPDGKVPMLKDNKPLRFVENELWQRNLVVTDINDPFFVFYPAKGEGKHPVAVILPGGGYSVLGWNKEGTEIADWLNSIGISAAILLYRAPDQRDAALCDTQRAIGIIRRDADKYGIDPSKVGVIGFSAGANLAARISTNWRKRIYERIDDADDFPCRPDFQLPIYLWDVTNKDTKKLEEPFVLRPEFPVDSETPPAFLSQAIDDFCHIETTYTYDRALRNAGVKSEVHAFMYGSHGYGLRQLGTPCDAWSSLATVWLKNLLFK